MKAETSATISIANVPSTRLKMRLMRRILSLNFIQKQDTGLRVHDLYFCANEF